MNLIWFRCDLRTTDNSALLAAADGRPCLALYLLSPAQWREHDDAPCKVDFWLRNLGELQRQLAALNIPLLVRDCGHWRQAPEVIGRLCRELGVGAVHVNQEYGVNEERRDQAVGQRLREQGVAFHSHLDQLFFTPGSVLTRTGGYFQVFSQFRKVCHERLYQALPGVRPRPQPQPPHALASDPLPDAVPALNGATSRRFPAPANCRPTWPPAYSRPGNAWTPRWLPTAASSAAASKAPRPGSTSCSGASSTSTSWSATPGSPGTAPSARRPKPCAGARPRRNSKPGNRGAPAYRSSTRQCASCSPPAGCTIACGWW